MNNTEIKLHHPPFEFQGYKIYKSEESYDEDGRMVIKLYAQGEVHKVNIEFKVED